jgi:hypothetical protein
LDEDLIEAHVHDLNVIADRSKPGCADAHDLQHVAFANSAVIDHR